MGIRVRSNYTDIVVETGTVSGQSPAVSPQSWRGVVTVDGRRGEFMLDGDFPGGLTLRLRLRFLYEGETYKAGSIVAFTPEDAVIDTNDDSMILGKLFDIIAAQLAIGHPKQKVCVFQEEVCSD